MVRHGSTLGYYVSEGRDGDFVLLDQWLFGAGRVKEVRLVGSTGGALAGLDFRITALQIFADSFGDEAGVAVPQLGRTTWLASALAVGLFVLAAGLVSRRSRQALANTRIPDAAGERSDPEVAGMVLFSCSQCGRSLKAKLTAVGKRVACPQCGQAVHVPAAGADSARPTHLARPAWQVWLLAVAVATFGVVALLISVAIWFWPAPTAAATLYLNKPFGAETVSGITEDGVWHTEYAKKNGEPFRWTNGAAKFVVPLVDGAPQGLHIRLGVPIPKSLKRLCIKINDKTLFDEPMDMPWEWSRTFDLSQMNLGALATIEIITDTFVAGNLDQRVLGVCVRNITLLRNVTTD
jgi:DNA-directed RNA polymerase subunit RPC12/RpoP